MKYDIGDTKIMDYNFHNKETGESLYCIIRRIDGDIQTSRNYQLNLDTKLYKKSGLR